MNQEQKATLSQEAQSLKRRIKMSPKFNIDDIVSYDDDFSYNPAYKALSIGKVIGIHIMRGNGLFAREKAKGKVRYTISGSSLVRREEELQPIKKKGKYIIPPSFRSLNERNKVTES